MNQDGNALVYCEKAFNTPYGKTAHGLVRYTRRYNVIGVIDSQYAGRDAGGVLDDADKGIPVYASLAEAIKASEDKGNRATHLVIGIAPDGGRLGPDAMNDVKEAIQCGLNIDSGLHDFMTEQPDFIKLASENKVVLRDIRKPPERSKLHFFSGKIEEVTALKIALLGTDSAVGKRTTAWILVRALEEAGYTAEMVGTGQTAWMQGARYSLILDSLINDFVAGEIEHAVYSAWKEQKPDVIIIEGQGSLMNPAYPGGFEILAAARPDIIVLQHAPARLEYDGFPGYPIHPLTKQIEALKLLSAKKVAAVTVNHENLDEKEIPEVCRAITEETGLPALDILKGDPQELVKVIKPFIKK
jgi:uncharacterized NAD-dependent epimerase/dehydratase family protein